MKQSIHATTRLTFLFIFLSLFDVYQSVGQTTRYQQNIRGGFTMVANSLCNGPGGQANGTKINTAGGASMSSYADLVLPVGSTIARAFLYVEGFTTTAITSVKFRVPGGAYTTLNTASAGFIGNPSTNVAQFIIDVTSLMPAAGYISSVTAGGDPTTNGRYAVADIAAFDAANFGYGWSLIVIYTNPLARYRNVTIADNNASFGCGLLGCTVCTVSFNVAGISVPSAGAYNAIVGFTGTYGDDGIADNVQFGKQGTALTNLTDPTTGTNSDLYNSTVGICAKNNVSVDATLVGFPIPMSGNVISRKPYNTYTSPNLATPNWYSYYYDADIIDASGILPNSATPINVTFTQNSSSGDCLGGGAYVVSVDIVSAVVTKSISPSTIQTGGTATYTWTIDNTLAGGLNLAGIGFTDILPANLIVANPPTATITGGTGGTITAVAGGTSVALSAFSLNTGETATMSVNVTNKAGLLNASCATNPLAFTNGFINISSTTANLANSVTNQCLVVVAVLSVDLVSFTARQDKGTVVLNWATASEKNNARYDIERSHDGINFSTIGNVKGNGNSTVPRNYSFVDSSPIAGANYYRLKLIDYNGETENTSILNVDITKFVNNVVVSPQPVKNNAEITLNANQECNTRAAIYDIAGRKVIQLPDGHLTEGANTMNIDLSMLGTGVYYLTISNTNGLQENIKILK